MKKFLSLFLAILMIVCTFSIATTAQAASKPKKVTLTSAVLTINYDYCTTSCKVKWKTQKGVKGYQLYFAIEGGDDSGYYYVKKKTVKGAKKNSVKVNCDFDDPETYYAKVKIRAYKIRNGKKVYGKWSKAKTIKWKEAGYIC